MRFPPKVRTLGFALISVLALVAVLAIMLGALMGTNRTAFGMLRVSAAHDRMDRTINSAFSYCRFRIEHDTQWAKGDFAGRGPVSWGQLRLTEVRGSGNQANQILKGEDLENKTQFTVEICNNLRDHGEVATREDVLRSDKRNGVPSGFCRLRIAVEGSGQLDGAEIMVRNPGLVSGVCLADQCLEIEANELELFTKDPVKNQARSLGVTQLTGARNFLEGETFEPDEALSQALASGYASRNNPVIWSGTQNLFALSSDPDPVGREEFKESHPDVNLRDQRFVDGSQSLFDIPDVGIDSLLQVQAANGDAKPVEKIPPGVYRFEQFYSDSSQESLVRVLTRRSPAPAGSDNLASGSIEKFWYLDEAETNMEADQVAARIGAPAGSGEIHESSQYVSINGGAAKVDVTNRRMVLDENYNFEVEGNFALIGSSVNGRSSERQVNPALYFGDPNAIAASGDFQVGDAVNTTAASKEKGSLKVRGELNIQGDISGSTTLAASGDVNLQIGRFFDPRGNTDVNFSVFSEQNVAILPPPIKEDRDDRDVDDVTGEVLSNGNAINVSEKDLKFSGLIYAGKDVTIDLRDTRNQSEKRNLFVEGAIVAKTGHLDITNADKLRLVYNPQFVDRLLPDLTRTGQRRIEVTGWRTTKPANLASR